MILSVHSKAMRLLVCAIALMQTFVATATSQQKAPADEADRILKSVMDGEALPSISVAVSRDGEKVFSRALGLADIEHKVQATPDTRYAIGSVAKSITAVAALKLAESGRLDLDAPVQEQCEAFPVKSQAVTVRQLLAHTAGVRHYDYRRFEEDFLNKVHYESIEEALTKFAADPLVAEPGTTYHYSSWGYVVVGCAIQGASGITYTGAIRSLVIQPAGMSQTGLDVVSEIIPNRVRGYSKSDSGALRNAVMFDPSDRYPAGGLLSTPGDLVEFADSLLAGELLGEKARQQMWTPARLSSGEETGHGMGWDLSPDGEAVFHGGTTVGTTTYLYVRPRERVAVAIAVNLSRWSGDRQALAARLADLFMGEGGPYQRRGS